ncbi:MAG: hypothetical protein CBD13_002370 [Candidatus Pelagibacter sp. TMED153]|nr:MAG: hypothetical protein CBD13_002370 [Candidatus Pelagibacter sp. TMED153]|tara:strand:+ start:5385 stop:5789 length:405 start_codon:yes stop_codon:yes gene_type:complete
MTKNKITLITISLLFFIAFFGTVFFTYNKPHKDFSGAQADITLEAAELYEHYQNNLSDANLKFLDKVLLVNGPVTELNSNLVIIGGNVVCSLDSSYVLDTGIKLDDKIFVKGRCIGYDDLFEEVRIDHCFIMQN